MTKLDAYAKNEEEMFNSEQMFSLDYLTCG
jgi:hypothetical protein